MLEYQNKLEVTNKISEQCGDAFQAMKLRRKHRFIIFRIGDEEIEGIAIDLRIYLCIVRSTPMSLPRGFRIRNHCKFSCPY